MKKTRVQKNKRKYKKNILLIIIKFLFKVVFWIIKHLIILLYWLIHHFDLLVAKVYSKLPRLIRVGLIYSLVFVALWGNFGTKNEVIKQKVVNKTIKVDFLTQKETQTVQNDMQISNTCNLSEIECKIYNKAREVELTHEQAMMIVAISKHETGNWTSRAFKNKNNFGGVMCNTGLKQYSSFEEGLNGFVNLLKNRYFNRGLDTVDKIGAVYCPVGASNDPYGLNQHWIPNVTKYYNEYLQK